MISEVFTLENYANLGMLQIIFFGAICLVAVPIITPFLILAYIIDAEFHKTDFLIGGAGISLYMLVDWRKEWILSIFHFALFDKEEQMRAAGLAGASVLICVGYLMIGDLLFTLCGRNRFLFLLLTAAIYLGAYFLCFLIFETKMIRII